MEINYFKSLIYKLNHNQTRSLIHLRPLSETVDFAKVWEEKPKPTDKIASPGGPYKFYFIKNDQGTYVASILDMWHDLHWFVLPGYRRKGHLTKALKETILYHLFQEREEQRITIDENAIGLKNFLASEKVALRLGFKKVKENNKPAYILKKNKYQTNNYFSGQNTLLTEARFEELKKHINFISNSLWLVQTEIEMKLGEKDMSEELIELKDNISKQRWRLYDICFKLNKNK